MVKSLKIRLGLSLFVFTSGIVGCNSFSKLDKVISREQTPVQPPVSKVSNIPFITLEKSVHEQVNQYRQSRNLPPLILDPTISEQSRLHSQAMASGKVPFSHQGFEQRVKSINKVIPYRASSENVAYNMGYRDPGQQAVQGWINSPGHRENMEGSYDLTGIGVAKNAKGEYYFTQIFIRRR